jgi:hypothetical protein
MKFDKAKYLNPGDIVELKHVFGCGWIKGERAILLEINNSFTSNNIWNIKIIRTGIVEQVHNEFFLRQIDKTFNTKFLAWLRKDEKK